MHSSREDVINFEISLVHRLLGELSQTAVSDFLTNGYGSSWDSTCENYESQSRTIESQFQKNNEF